MAFPIEEIPPQAALFRRIHEAQYDAQTGKVSSAAFKQDDMSVNWEKYRNAKDSAEVTSAAVVAITCGDCLGLGQTVKHDPIEPDQPFGPNQAHTEVRGSKKGEISRKLRDLGKLVWVRPPKSAPPA